MAELLLKSQYDGWYTTLNQIRAKHNKANISVNTVAVNSVASASQMSALQTSVNEVKTSTDNHLTKASINTTIPNIAAGNQILLSTKSSIDTILASMLSVCHHDSSDYSGRDDHDSPSSDCSCDSQCSCDTQCSCDSRCSCHGYCSDCQRGDDSGYGHNASY